MDEMVWLDIFGDNLADMLAENRMTQRDLADKANLAESTISDYIHKRKMPGTKAIVNIAYALNCGTDDLVDFGERID